MAVLQLPPAPTPIGLFQQFIPQSSQTLVLKEKVFSLSGDSFDVKTADSKETVFQVKGETFTLSGRKHFLDSKGSAVFDLRKEHFAIHKTFYGENEAGDHLFEVRKKLQLIGSKAVCTFISITGVETELVLEGDFFDSRAEISTKDGQVVAVVDRKYFNAREFIGGQQTYCVSIASNVDLAVITAMCICLDELRNEES